MNNENSIKIVAATVHIYFNGITYYIEEYELDNYIKQQKQWLQILQQAQEKFKQNELQNSTGLFIKK